MFKKSAQFYDLIYSFKDYDAEAQQVHAWIEQYKQAAGTALLDVACGTGHHMSYLQQHYAVEGLDLDDQILAVARERLPDVRFYEASMIDFDLGQRYDAITCLFSAIAYVQTEDKLRQTLVTMYRHLKPGGVVIVEGFIQPEAWRGEHVHGLYIDEPDLKIARINNSQREGNLVTLEFHYLVGTVDAVQCFVEEHKTALFSDADYVAAFESAGFAVEAFPNGLMDNRTVFIGLRPGD